MRYLSFMVGVFLAQVSLADDKIILQHGATVVRQSDLLEAISTFVPEEKVQQYFSDETRLRDTLARILIQRKLAEEAKGRVLTSRELANIDAATIRALSQVQIEYLVRQRKAPNFEAAALEAYRANKKKYITPERVQVEHILIDSKSRSDEVALKRANEIRDRIDKGGIFTDLAKEYSDDPSVSKNNGDLGLFARGAMVKEFEDAAFGLASVGEVSAPVRTQYGYHIIRLMRRSPEGVLPFESVKDELVKVEKGKFRDRVVNEEFDRVSKIDGVKINQDVIKEMIEESRRK